MKEYTEITFYPAHSDATATTVHFEGRDWDDKLEYLLYNDKAYMIVHPSPKQPNTVVIPSNYAKMCSIVIGDYYTVED